MKKKKNPPQTTILGNVHSLSRKPSSLSNILHIHSKNRDEHSYAYNQRSENIYSLILTLTLRTA